MSEETETAETEPTAEEVLASIHQAVVDAGDLHRNRARRELLTTILGILDGVEPDSITVSAPAAPEAEPEEEDDSLKAPPLFGPGSTLDAWRQYAVDLGLEVPEGAKRAEIVALIQATEDDEPGETGIDTDAPSADIEDDADPDGALDDGGDPDLDDEE